MPDHLLNANKWLERRMFLLTLVGLAAGYLFPIANSPVLRLTAVILFGYVTLVTSMSTSFKQFLLVLRQPAIPLWTLFLTHFITPLIAWATGMLFFPHDPFIRLGFLIGASVPVGVSSIVWTALARGCVALSLVVVSLDTLLTPIILPSFFKLIAGTSVQINYWQMAMQLLAMVTIPSLIGMIWHDRSGSSILVFSRGTGGFTAKLAILTVIYINSAVAVSGTTWSPALAKTALVTMCIVLAGFMTGYCGSRPLKDRSSPMVMTMIYNVGLRNISVGLVLALSHFPPPVAVPVTLYILFQQPLAAAIPYVFNRGAERR